MPGSNEQKPKKRFFDFRDIFSMLGDDKSSTAAPPTPEPAVSEPESPVAEPPAPEPTAEVAQPEPEPAVAMPEPETPAMEPPAPEPVAEPAEPGPAAVEVARPEPEAAAETAEPEPEAVVIDVPEIGPAAVPPQAAARQDPTLVDRLLVDFAEKNAEILRLNNELAQLRFELKEREQQIAVLEAAEDELKRALEDQIAGKQELGQEKDAALAARDEELRARDAKITEIEAKMSLMSEQFGVLRRLRTRESSHEPFEGPAAAGQGSAVEQPEAPDAQEPEPAEDSDVASIFMRLAGGKREDEEGGGNGERPPRRPRSAKLYDL